MISTLHKSWTRVSRMSWEEIQTRLRQSVYKRIDLAKYRASLTARLRLRPHSSKTGKFFFSELDLPRISSLLRDCLGDEVEQILDEADEVCQHRFHLLGYKNLDFGREINWHLDVVHGIQAPRQPWFKIPFLDFSVVGDHKVIWELNRHQHLVTLAKAWVLTRQEKYATELIQQWYAWQFANPYPIGINWCSSLEVAFRSLSWLWVHFLLSGCPAIPANFKSDLQLAIAVNARHIERYLSTYFSPNTHLLGEAVGLFFIGTLCQEIRGSERWRNNGWQTILREAQRQVRQDGVYFEQSLHYHVYALDMFLHARTLAERNNVEAPADFDAVIRKMLSVLQALGQVGPPHSFGDDDGGRLFNPRRNRNHHLTDPLAIGAVLLDWSDLRSSVSLTEEAVWLLGQKATSSFAATSDRQIPRAVDFDVSGIYVMASSEGCPQQMVVDAGPTGSGSAGHGHADALSITLSLDGRQWLVDPGTCSYTANQGRSRYRGTRAHNTVSIDGLDQAVSTGPFSWSSLPRVRAERWCTGETFSLFAGSHDGYSRLHDPVLHRRYVFYLHGGFWLVRDVIEGREAHDIESSWHFAPNVRAEDKKNFFVIFPADCETKSNTRLAVVRVQNSAWSCRIDRDEVSPAYGLNRPATTLRMHAHVRLPVENVTLLHPLLSYSNTPGKLNYVETLASGPNHGPSRYRYDESMQTHQIIFGNGAKAWTSDLWRSDAEFIYYQIRNRELVHLILCNATFAYINGAPVVTARRKVERLEWLNRNAKERVFSSDMNVSEVFSDSALHSNPVLL